MKIVLAVLLMFVAGCVPASGRDLSLSFGAFTSSPVLLTHMGVERPMAEIGGAPILIGGSAEKDLPRTSGGMQAGWPKDRGGDGIWRIELQWIEIPTTRAYRAAFDVPIADITERFGISDLGLVFGPNGMAFAASDILTQDNGIVPNALGGICGVRVPTADADYRGRTDAYPQIALFLRRSGRIPASAQCPAPGG